MKISIIFLLLIFSPTLLSQKHHSDSQVLKWIHDNWDEGFELQPVQDFKSKYVEEGYYKKIANSLNLKKPVYTADFDKNGVTDYLIIGTRKVFEGYYVLVVMNYGTEEVYLVNLTHRHPNIPDIYPKIINGTTIRCYSTQKHHWEEQGGEIEFNYTDLIFKFGGFVEHNPSPKTHKIKNIEYSTSYCFGTCPVFNLSISEDKTALFEAIKYNVKPSYRSNRNEIKGEFNTILREDKYQEIVDILNYINFSELKDYYGGGWSDGQTVTAKITYDNGEIKEIKDYGLIGTYGLKRLHRLLFDLRFNHNWQRITK